MQKGYRFAHKLLAVFTSLVLVTGMSPASALATPASKDVTNDAIVSVEDNAASEADKAAKDTTATTDIESDPAGSSSEKAAAAVKSSSSESTVAGKAKADNPVIAAIEELTAAGDPSASKVIGTYSSGAEAIAQTAGLSDDALCYVTVEAELTPDGEKHTLKVLATPLWNPNSSEIALSSNMTQSSFNSTLRAGWLNQSSSINVQSFSISPNDIAERYYCAIMDNPDCFNVYTGLQYSYSSTGYTTSVSPYYVVSSGGTYNGKTFSQMQAAFDAQVSSALSNISDGMSDLAKVTVLHDWLCGRTEYNNTEASSSSTLDRANYTAYGTMVNQTGVCQSYTMALGTLLKAAGVESAQLMVGSMNHAWNVVKIDGRWYHVDSTWDDQSWGISRSWYLKSDSAFPGHDVNSGTHSWLLGPNYSVYGYDDSLACTSTRFDNVNWNSYNPRTDADPVASDPSDPVNPPSEPEPSTPDPIDPGDRMGLLTLGGVTASFDDDTEYPWISKDGKLVSSNTGVANSTSSTTLYLSSDNELTLDFDWAVSSEFDWDKLSIYLDAEIIVNEKSGSEEGSVHQNLCAGSHFLTFVYSKDGSKDDGDDRALISNFRATSTGEGTTPGVDPSIPDSRIDALTLHNVEAALIDGDGAYPWVLENGTLASSNTGIHNSSSVTTVSLFGSSDYTISFDWNVSSEGYCDKLSISLDGTLLVDQVSGTQQGTVNSDVSAGTHVITLTYSKDGSVNRGDDCARISNFTATAKDQRLSILSLENASATFADGEYPWAVDGNKLISTNTSIDNTDSITTISLSSDSPFTISFDWGVSSEANYDKLSIILDENTSTANTLVDAVSGTKYGNVKENVTAGTHTLTLKYHKDSSQSVNDDRGWISNFKCAPQSGSTSDPDQSDYSAARGSADFLRWIAQKDSRLTEQQVQDVIDSFTVPYYVTNVGAAGDATSLDNMTTIAALVREINRLRATEGAGALKIDALLLFESQCRANYGATYMSHSEGNGASTAENLAFGTRTPENAAQAWWSEKSRWEQALEENPEYANMSDYNLYLSNPSLYMNVGHYLNMRNASYTIVGAGLSTYSSKAYCANFSGSYYDRCSFTVDEFEALLNEYLGIVKNDSHQHTYGDPQVEFGPGYNSARATWTCESDPSHTYSTTVGTTIYSQTAATCYRQGETVYYVTFQPAEEGISPFSTSTRVTTPASGHSYNSLHCCTTCNHLFLDVNKNGKVNIVDAQIAYDVARGTYNGSALIDEYRIDADANNDSYVEAADARAIQCYVMTGSLN